MLRRPYKRNPGVIVHQLAASQALGKPVRCLLVGGGRREGYVVRSVIDEARRQPKPDPRGQHSHVVVEFADGSELAVNSIARVIPFGEFEDDEE